MKKKILTGAIFLTCFTLIVYAISNGGSQSDPLVTQSQAQATVNENIETYLDQNFESFEDPITAIVSDVVLQNLDRICFVENDVITGLDMGDKISIRTGDITISGTGSVVNLSTTEEIVNPTSLSSSVQYLITEDSDFTITVNSLIAQIYIVGDYEYTNPYSVIYTDYANALYSLGLFSGSNYGYQLDRPATRLESLVMFIRLIGEEEQALAFEGSHNFTDVDTWAEKYVAYAYNQGYTNGMTETEFGSTRYVRDLDYYTFILRALGYVDNVDFTWAIAYDKAKEIGLIPEDFESYYELYRDHLVFVSFNSLGLTTNGQTTTLSDALIQNGLFDPDIYNEFDDKLS